MKTQRNIEQALSIQQQIERIPEGKIFTSNDLDFPIKKQASVAVMLSNLAKEQQLVRIEKGAYYKPKLSRLGLGFLPVYQEEQLNYLTNKLSGYLTGTYIYNKMALTQQMSSVITIAVPKPVRAFKFNTLSVECVKAYVPQAMDDSQNLFLVRILDAIKDLKNIPGLTPQEAFERIYTIHIALLSSTNLQKIVSLSLYYPPRVRKVLGDMLGSSSAHLSEKNEFTFEQQCV
jgi:hypothetical protein